MGAASSVGQDERAPLTLERARNLAGDQWDAERFGPYFEGADAPPTLADALRIFHEAGGGTQSIIVSFVPGVGVRSKVVERGGAKQVRHQKQVRHRALRV